MLHSTPDNSSTAVSQLLFGERFAVIDAAGGWAWGFSEHDGYVGYVREQSLGPVKEPTHIVTAARALIFVAPDIKSAVVDHLPNGARLTGWPVGGFVETARGFVHCRHAGTLPLTQDDPVAVAERLVGMPYLWGGRGAGGIDCSGLVQLAFGMCGQAVPRDSDLQRAAIGQDVGGIESLQRGDLVFFPGHVGIMVDGDRLIHANAYWMAVTVEPLALVVARVAQTVPQPLLAMRRLTK